MADIEKVIKQISAEIKLAEYVNKDYQIVDLSLLKDALELLKEQEAVKPKYNARTNWYECGNCHYSMTSGMHCRSELIPATKVRYCANCGFPVNWEGR